MTTAEYFKLPIYWLIVNLYFQISSSMHRKITSCKTNINLLFYVTKIWRQVWQKIISLFKLPFKAALFTQLLCSLTVWLSRDAAVPSLILFLQRMAAISPRIPEYSTCFTKALKTEKFLQAKAYSFVDVMKCQEPTNNYKVFFHSEKIVKYFIEYSHFNIVNF